MDWIFDSLPLLIFAYFVLQALAGAVRGGRKSAPLPPPDDPQREQAERVAEMLRRLGVPVPELDEPPVTKSESVSPPEREAPSRASRRPPAASPSLQVDAASIFDHDAGFERDAAFEREAAFERSGRAFGPPVPARSMPSVAGRRPPPPPPATPRATSLLARMRQPDALREAFVMQMILDRRGAQKR